MIIDVSDYMDIFLSESREHLDKLNKVLLELERHPDDRDKIDEIFRSAHTLKGMAATMGFKYVSELAHKMENVLGLIRNGEIEVTGELVDDLLVCLDFLEAMIESISKDGDEVDAGPAFAKLNAILNAPDEVVVAPEGANEPAPEREEAPGAEEAEAQAPEEEELQSMVDQKAAEGFTVYRIDVTLDQETALKSVRAFMVFKNIESLGEIIKAIPDAEEIEDENFDLDFSIFLATKETADQVSAVVSLVKGVTNVDKVVYRKMESDKEVEPAVAEETAEEKKAEPEKKQEVTAPRRREEVKSIQSVRVGIDRLDNLMNLVGELVITKGRLRQIEEEVGNDALSETVDAIDRLTTDLQDGVMIMRMVEVGRIFDRFPRMVRDLARKRGKKIKLDIDGKDIEMDRTVLDEIGDPLVHLLRNAVDHGIENPKERRSRDKPDEGTLRLVARREKNHVEIVVEDDGRGLDLDNIRSSAVRKGLFSEEEIKKLDDDEIMRLIFMPGFSTKKTVTDVSGRGVGMDVVHNKVTSLGGTVDLSSVPGKGSRFVLKLPLTLAIIQALLVEMKDEVYAVPLNNVVETLAIAPKDIKTIKGQEAYVLRGNVLPLIRLKKLIGMPEAEAPRVYSVVVVEWSGKAVGLVVDVLIGQQEIVIKSLGDFLKGVRGFAGATILGDGRVILILDIATLV